jgi:translation initiation factor IF-3
MSHSELGAEVLMNFAEDLSDVGQVEEGAKMEGRNMTMVLAPKRG